MSDNNSMMDGIIPYVLGGGGGGGGASTAAIEAMIAGEELSSISAKHYNVGDHIIYNDAFFEVIQEINIGDTITSGTNVKQETIGDCLTDVKGALNNIGGEEFHVGTGQQYTTLRAGIEAAVQKKNSKVIIHP